MAKRIKTDKTTDNVKETGESNKKNSQQNTFSSLGEKQKKYHDTEKITKTIIIIGICAVAAVAGFAMMIDGTGESGVSQNAVSVNSREQNIIKNAGKVMVNIPEIYLHDESTNVLTKEQTDFGFESATVNDNKSVTYVIYEKEYERYIDHLYTQMKTRLDSIVSSGEYKSIKKIEYNESLTKISITVDRNTYDGSWDNYALYDSFEYIGNYQAMQGYSAKGIKARYYIIDASNGETYDTIDFPEALSQNF